MRWLSAVALVVLLANGTSLAEDKRPKLTTLAPDPEVCAQASASARYVGVGYTHSVTLKNSCPKPIECTLWTDVDPEPRVTVRAAPSESVEIVTRRGSPARAVTAFKSCHFR